MAIKNSAADKVASKQQGLFDNGPAEGSLDIVLGLKQLLSKLLRGHDRYLVAAQISRATLKEISKDSLDKVLSSDPAYQPSALLVVAITQITDCLEPLQYLAEPVNAYVVGPDDHDLMEMSRLQEQERIIKAKISNIMSKRGLK